MQTELPDITQEMVQKTSVVLDEVGMQQLDLLLQLSDGGDAIVQPVKANIGINLPRTDARGIHMSRLYRLLNDFAGQQLCTPANLKQLLQQLLDSHLDCHSDQVVLELSFDRLCKHPALITPGLSGWRRYPVQLRASLSPKGFLLKLQLAVQYSSTCPCSAALSRQLLQQKFLADFSDVALSKANVADWLLQHGSYATPHSQRSVASIELSLAATATGFPISAVIEQAEAALATPVQTAVKRADEQEFARLNGANLMFVEDAARRLAASLRPQYPDVCIEVQHLESLHPHDAYARIHASREF
ncbi:GTP cyclohydrolase FolE2 [Alkalimonas amylolytica]|uniref:GTP cyclohydrolase FolE2 n=1 Tax=Alkalimonas amylolytica TaxID=152573 RepID=A0A1H4E903_ALKAM|nr:GTP cyclohydrolase FolE2 [Alkalimonas amylolytica]SEA81541.1 GTP cyclohydrolase I [Alkalimonas amylolytica]